MSQTDGKELEMSHTDGEESEMSQTDGEDLDTADTKEGSVAEESKQREVAAQNDDGLRKEENVDSEAGTSNAGCTCCMSHHYLFCVTDTLCVYWTFRTLSVIGYSTANMCTVVCIYTCIHYPYTLVMHPTNCIMGRAFVVGDK